MPTRLLTGRKGQVSGSVFRSPALNTRPKHCLLPLITHSPDSPLFVRTQVFEIQMDGHSSFPSNSVTSKPSVSGTIRVFLPPSIEERCQATHVFCLSGRV